MNTKSSKVYKVELTKAEINALFLTADQMKDDMHYYDFMGPKRSENFRNAYDSAMTKIRKYI
jgi:hypothetical protein